MTRFKTDAKIERRDPYNNDENDKWRVSTFGGMLFSFALFTI